jgi:hypothetical protein
MQLLFVVIAVVLCVLGLVFAGVYYLNKSIDQSGR